MKGRTEVMVFQGCTKWHNFRCWMLLIQQGCPMEWTRGRFCITWLSPLTLSYRDKYNARYQDQSNNSQDCAEDWAFPVG
jgi:hypothetical protein